MHEQVRELCTNYGKLDLLWFDFSYDDMRGEKWRATELMQMVRELQPDVIIDNRLEVSGEGFGSLAECKPTPYHGDFVTPERIIPPNGLFDVEGNPCVGIVYHNERQLGLLLHRYQLQTGESFDSQTG